MRTILVVTAMAAMLAAGVAEATTVTDFTGAQGWMMYDVRDGGVASINVNQPRDGNGSLMLATTQSTPAGLSGAKTTVIGFRTDLQPMGTLGALSELSFDWFRAGANVIPQNDFQAPNFKLHVLTAAGESAMLAWEFANNRASGQPAPTNQWIEQGLLDQKLWIRSGGTNYMNASDWHTLGEFIGGVQVGSAAVLGPDTLLMGIEIGNGSWVYGDYVAYADAVHASFTAGETYDYNFEVPTAPVVPEPLSMGSLALAIAGLGGYLRRRTA